MIIPQTLFLADDRTQARSKARGEVASWVYRGWLLAVVAGGLGLIPLLIERVTPLQDWPSHLARIQILAEMMAGPSPWTRFYEVHSFFLPNVVLDALTLGLLKLGLGIDLAGRTFLVLLYLVFVGGFLRLAAAFDAGGPLKLMLGVLLFYNGSLFYGLVNFEFGLGLMMLFVGSWYQSGPLWRLFLVTFGTLAVFECHLVAAFIYAGVLGSLDLYELVQTRGRSLTRSTSVVALAVAVLSLLLSPTGHDGFQAVWDGSGSLASFAAVKAGLFAKTLLGGSFHSDAVFVGGFGLFLAVAVAGCRVELRWPVIFTIVVTGLMTVAAPGHLGAGSLLDYRIALVPWLFLGAGFIIAPRKALTRQVLLSLLFLLILARGSALAWSWRGADSEFAALDEAMAKLPRDSALLVGRGRLAQDVPWREFWAFPYNTIPTYAVRYGVFVSSVYAHPAQQPLVLKPEYRSFSDFNDVSAPALLSHLQQSDAVRELCRNFPAGVAMAVLFPTPAGLPGMVRIGNRFGLLDMCVNQMATVR